LSQREDRHDPPSTSPIYLSLPFFPKVSQPGVSDTRHTPPSRGESLDHDIHMAFEEEIGDSPPSLWLWDNNCCDFDEAGSMFGLRFCSYRDTKFFYSIVHNSFTMADEDEVVEMAEEVEEEEEVAEMNVLDALKEVRFQPSHTLSSPFMK